MAEKDDMADALNDLREDETPAISMAAEPKQEPEPSITSPEWNDFVMSNFTSEEVDSEGHPFVAGLRRVGRKLLGPVLASQARVIAPPRYENGVAQPVTVEHYLKLYWTRLETDGPSDPYIVEFTECADVSAENADPAFARFPAGLGATRAEARNWRKALGLRRVAAEEKTLVPLPENTGPIRAQQILFIDTLARKLKINVMKFIAAGKVRHKKIEDVPYTTALQMLETLSGYQNDPESIPAKLTGYDPNWRAS
jgi:hypothetical protein